MTPPRSFSRSTGKARRLDPVDRYAKDVLSGKELAGPLVRLACERHNRDRDHGEKRGLKWEWTDDDGKSVPGTGKWVCDFFRQVLRLAGGEHEGQPFRLHRSQIFILGSLFGWKQNGRRRFRVAYIEEGKGNGKSPFAAGIGLYMLKAAGELGFSPAARTRVSIEPEHQETDFDRSIRESIRAAQKTTIN